MARTSKATGGPSREVPRVVRWLPNPSRCRSYRRSQKFTWDRVEDCITIVGAGKRCTRGGIRIGPASELRNRHIISQGIREAVIDKLGFFHFGNYWDDPVG